MKIAKSILLLLLVFTILNCSKSEDANNNSNSNFTQNFGNVTNRDFIGQIVDENNQALEGVEIKIGSISKRTDSKGVFVIKNAEVYEKFAYVTAKKSGYINGSRTVVPNSGSNTVKIMMLTATVQATVASGIASNITLSNGTKVTFDGNFKTESGAAYSGSVKVMMHHLDPSDPSTSDKMPGSLMGENNSGAQCALETYGMLNIELQDVSGNKIQIVNPSSIEIQISSSHISNAPSTIPMWYFDETNGYWKEEGSATKVGNKYVGSVSHFSWWNCDLQFPTITLGITIVNSNQVPMSGVRIELVRDGQTYGVNGYANAVGQVSGLVPANEILMMNIYSTSSGCTSQSIYSQQIGPFSSNVYLPLVELPAAILNSITVQGTIINCNNNNVTNGYVWLQTPGQFLYTQVVNGSFTFNVLNCSSTAMIFNLQGYDLDTMKLTSQQEGTLNNQTVSLGIMQACVTSITIGELLDIDQNRYTYVPIGQQTWMQQNLNVSRYSDGTIIPEVSDSSIFLSLTTGAWRFSNNDPANGAIYGKQYNWYAAAGIYDDASLNDPSLRKQLAPSGWHVPSDAEWTILTTYLGGESVAGGKMKSTSTLWTSPNTNAINSSGFTGLPGGINSGSIGRSGYWWSTSMIGLNTAFCRILFNDYGACPTNFVESRNHSLSVRCVRN